MGIQPRPLWPCGWILVPGCAKSDPAFFLSLVDDVEQLQFILSFDDAINVLEVSVDGRSVAVPEETVEADGLPHFVFVKERRGVEVEAERVRLVGNVRPCVETPELVVLAYEDIGVPLIVVRGAFEWLSSAIISSFRVFSFPFSLFVWD